MSSEAVSSAPSSPVSQCSLTSKALSPPSSPQRKRRKYGREYEKGDPLDDLLEESNDSLSSDHDSERQQLPYEINDDNSGELLLSSSDDSSSCASSVGSVTPIPEDTDLSDSSSVSSDSSRLCSVVVSDTDENECAQKLYDGSAKTTDEAVLHLMELYIKRRWDQTTLKDILSFNNKFFPSNMPTSLYKLFSYIEDLTPTNYREIKHYYCSGCLSPREQSEVQCENCGSSVVGVFFELPLATQIKHFFEHRKLASHIDSYSAVVSDGSSKIFDICSGNMYKQVKETLSGIYDITLSFNSDGVSLVHSSRAHLYPILATINEVPPQFRSGFMIVCGIWYDPTSSPIMNNFLSLFVNSLKDLSVSGVSWTHLETKEEITSVVVAPLLIADALARADMLGMQQCNSKYACNTCEQKTVRVNAFETPTQSQKQRKLRRFVYQEEPARLRDDSRMEMQGEKAARTGQAVKGVTGNAIVSQIPHFKRSSSAFPDYMHLVLLGVVKLLINLWFFIPGEWNIKNRMKDIDAFIRNNVKVTDHFSRIPQGLKDFKNWKANDLRSWLLFVSLPALCEILPDKYFQHYLYLVSAMYTLLGDEISQNDVNIAETKLRLFVRDIGVLYRKRDYVYNVHNLLHLSQYVRSWGPLWATSVFVFESFNHVLGQLAHGTKHKGQEIVGRLRLTHGVQVLRSKVGPAGVSNTIDDVLGRPVNIPFDFDLPNGTETYARARFKSDIFTCKSYDTKKRRANSYVQFSTPEGSIGYGRVVCFYLRETSICSLIEKVQVRHTKIFCHTEGRFQITHLIPFSETRTVISAPVSCLTKLAKVGDYLCLRPNAHEKNL